MQARRSFLKLLGLGAAAVAVGPRVLRAVPEKKPDLVFTENSYIGQFRDRVFCPADYLGAPEWERVDGFKPVISRYPLRYDGKFNPVA